MSYLANTCSSVSDLFSQLGTFLGGTPGWTITTASGVMAARKNGAGYDICFAAHWDTGTPGNVGIYQWYNAAYNTGAHPSGQTNDSGNGVTTSTNATLANQRHVALGSTPIRFWVFEDDHYFHVVVEVSTNTYVHFGAGQLDKFNDWTGGEYVYGFRQDTSNANTVIAGSNTKLLDGLVRSSGTAPTLTNAQLFAATVHAEGLPGQGGSEKWLVCMGDQASASLGTDRAAVARGHMIGGYRGGPFAKAFGMFRGTIQRGLCPMAPIVPFYWRRSPDELYGPMGQMKDVRMINCRDFANAEEIIVGSDTWTVFPSYFKSSADGTTAAGESGYQGIAYRKVTT